VVSGCPLEQQPSIERDLHHGSAPFLLVGEGAVLSDSWPPIPVRLVELTDREVPPQEQSGESFTSRRR
jgi:hypothetical protein